MAYLYMPIRNKINFQNQNLDASKENNKSYLVQCFCKQRVSTKEITIDGQLWKINYREITFPINAQIWCTFGSFESGLKYLDEVDI